MKTYKAASAAAAAVRVKGALQQALCRVMRLLSSCLDMMILIWPHTCSNLCSNAVD